MKLKLLVALVTIFLLTFGASYGQDYELVLDHVDGLVQGTTDTLAIATDITFHIRFTNPGSPNEANIKGSSNAFRVYSLDGATWTPITWAPYFDYGTYTWVYPFAGWPYIYNGAIKLNEFSVTGSGADTIGFAGYSDPSGTPPSNGVVPGFSQVVYTITTQVDAAQAGRTLCLDSCFYPPQNEWLWSTDTLVAGVPGSTGDVRPAWDGPHCFSIRGGSDVAEREPGSLPDNFALSQNYPNPFNPTTTIYFDIPVRSHVNLTIYNVLGQGVKTLVDESLAPGKYEETWDGTSDGGAHVATGIYFYKIEAESFVETKKMMLLK